MAGWITAWKSSRAREVAALQTNMDGLHVHSWQQQRMPEIMLGIYPQLHDYPQLSAQCYINLINWCSLALSSVHRARVHVVQEVEWINVGDAESLHADGRTHCRAVSTWVDRVWWRRSEGEGLKSCKCLVVSVLCVSGWELYGLGVRYHRKMSQLIGAGFTVIHLIFTESIENTDFR